MKRYLLAAALWGLLLVSPATLSCGDLEWYHAKYPCLIMEGPGVKYWLESPGGRVWAEITGEQDLTGPFPAARSAAAGKTPVL